MANPATEIASLRSLIRTYHEELYRLVVPDVSVTADGRLRGVFAVAAEATRLDERDLARNPPGGYVRLASTRNSGGLPTALVQLNSVHAAAELVEHGRAVGTTIRRELSFEYPLAARPISDVRAEFSGGASDAIVINLVDPSLGAFADHLMSLSGASHASTNPELADTHVYFGSNSGRIISVVQLIHEMFLGGTQLSCRRAAK
ncbi:hypothetical protein PRIPAC_91546 [Pristionchus pacificus]|uniref:Uncharacterized protein n=1 Tax=Pristionchus pacificus TaxID=54126 RepID=A0A2A6BR74_PRIPA|nr:hypothetical protein PRIPAC_91546 [Pristionchus pacificus]|eukprot:PDM68410.1 hypothetical protein PRIPAC_46454 [Pristionchus pacificus]